MILWLLLLSFHSGAASAATPFWQSCAQAFRFGKAAEDPPALAALARWLHDPAQVKRMKADGELFTLKIRGQKGSLKVGIARRDQRRLNALILKALREGSLNDIDLGEVTGPKSLILIDRLRELGEAEGLSFSLRGRFDVAFLRDRAHSHQELNLPPPSAFHYSAAEQTALAAAYRNLGLDACEERGAGAFVLTATAGRPASFTCQ